MIDCVLMSVKKRTVSPDWTDLQHFIALARLGSLSAAARELGVTHATVARRIAALESVLRKELYTLRSGRCVLTAEGERIAALAQPMSEQALALWRGVHGLSAELTGPVRLTATDVFGAHFVVPCVKAFHDLHPGIEIELVIDHRNLSLARRDADIALRLARPQGGDVLARRVGLLTYHFYAARADNRRADPSRLPLIGYDDSSLHTPEAQHCAEYDRARPIALRTNNQVSRIAAVRAGLGAALLPKFVGDALGDVARVDIGIGPLNREIWLLVHNDLKDVPRVRVCCDHLVVAIHEARHRLGDG